jgi:glycosyltransferase involved in cell wall biosynthesis
MKQAPVSVVIPCYRSRETVRVALASVLGQTLQPAEILLVDDASGDGTLEFLRALEREHASAHASAHAGALAAELAQQLRVIALARNGGPGPARNAGWEAATQPWLAFLDADDAWHPRKLEIQWAWLASRPDVALCGHCTWLSADGSINHPVGAAPSATRLTLARMLISNRLPTRSVMLRRDLPFRFRGRDVTEDYLLWLQLIAAGVPAWRLEVPLACSFRPDFSPGGYSGQLWAHEKRELAALQTLRSEGLLTWPAWAAAAVWSVVKFQRRRWLMRSMR